MAKDWTPVRAEIHSLYHVRKLPLSEVMSLVQDKFGFIASERSYRTQLLKWGYTKYSTQAHPKPERHTKRRSNVRREATDTASAASAASAASDASHDDAVLPGASGTQDTSTRVYLPVRPGSVSPTSCFVPALPPLIPSDPILSYDGVITPDSHANEGKSPLHQAVIRNDVVFVKASLSTPSGRVLIDVTDDIGYTPLHYAVRANGLDNIDMLLGFGAEANARGQHGRSPLHLAAALGHIEAVNALLEGGADVSMQDHSGNTPLHLALRSYSSLVPGAVSVVETLVEVGADTNKANDTKITPFLSLMYMPHGERQVQHGQIYDLILLFLHCGGDVSKPLNGVGQTPLELFLSRANLQRAFTGRTPHSPAGNKENEVLRRFLDNGALTAVPNLSLESLLVNYFSNHYARDDADLELARIFCEQCSPHHIFCDGGGILLHLLLTHCGHGERNTDALVELLLSRGADPNHQDRGGQTPLSLLLGTDRDVGFAARMVHALAVRGAGVAPRDIFAAAKHFSANEGILRELLQAYIGQMDEVTANALHRHFLPIVEQRRWWYEWRQVANAGEWGELWALIKNWEDSVFPGIDPALAAMAYAVLAERLVEASRFRVQQEPAEKETERGYVADILRVCRSHQFPVGMACFDYLLELCL